MLIVAALLLLALGASAHGVRTAGPGARWPFWLAAGRDTWSSWVSGSPSSEGLTLWVVLVVGPLLLLTCGALLALGTLLRRRQRSRLERGPTEPGARSRP